MSGRRIGVRVSLAAIAAAVAASGRAEGPSPADRLAFRQYQVELQRVLAEERAPGGLAPGRSYADCRLFQVGADRVPAQECMGCHGLHRTHPVEIDYALARAKPGAELRAPEEVVRRGVFLPEGKVLCVSCHDPTSRWAHHLAIPPGALVRRAVNVADPSTYERPVAPSRPEALPAGTSVSPTPLCRACHTMGD